MPDDFMTETMVMTENSTNSAVDFSKPLNRPSALLNDVHGAVDLSKPLQTPSSPLNDVDSVALKHAIGKAADYPGLTSLLIVKNGYLISENYFKQARRESVQKVCSVSKTFIGISIGIAVKQGYIAGIDDPISRYLKKLPANWDEQKNRITIRHLLSMTNGLEFSDDPGHEDYHELLKANDPVLYVLSKPMAAEPGEKFNDDPSAFLLSAIITDVTGMSALDFARTWIFRPLKFGKRKWRSIGGCTAGMNGLSIRPLDMAKFGQLLLQNGFNGKDSLLPSGWVKEMSSGQSKNGIGAFRNNMGTVIDANYGLMCWIARMNDLNFFWAMGSGGQRMLVIPQKRMVVVMTASMKQSFFMSKRRFTEKRFCQERDLLQFFIDHILPCAK